MLIPSHEDGDTYKFNIFLDVPWIPKAEDLANNHLRSQTKAEIVEGWRGDAVWATVAAEEDIVDDDWLKSVPVQQSFDLIWDTLLQCVIWIYIYRGELRIGY